MSATQRPNSVGNPAATVFQSWYDQPDADPATAAATAEAAATLASLAFSSPSSHPASTDVANSLNGRALVVPPNHELDSTRQVVPTWDSQNNRGPALFIENNYAWDPTEGLPEKRVK